MEASGSGGETTDLSDMTMGSEEDDINGNAQVPPPVSRRAREARKAEAELIKQRAQVRPFSVVPVRYQLCMYMRMHVTGSSSG